jgi:hypothetical protein
MIGWGYRALFMCLLFLGYNTNAQAACYVYLTEYSGEADHKVYFTEYSGEQKNHALIEGCKLTNYSGQATFKIYITKYSGESSIIIMRQNFPKP